MSRFRLFSAVVLAAALAFIGEESASWAQINPPDETVTVGDDTVEVVVDLRDSDADESAAISARLGFSLRPNSGQSETDGIFIVRVPRAQEATVIAQLRRDERVTAVEENSIMRASYTPNDPRFGEQWGVNNVRAPRSWGQTCGEGAVVAVVDTGVACEDYGGFRRLADLGQTHCAPGWSFVSNDNHAVDDQSHGSHVAGTIAQSTNNGIGVAGVAYCATIMPVKVLDSRGSGTLANVAQGVRWAADHGANVINMSLGGGGRGGVMAEAVAYARRHGVVVICAAGNNGRYVESPAVEEGSFAVSAINSSELIANFSSRGPEVDIAAPGVNILQQTIDTSNPGNPSGLYVALNGTSMATPHVAGVAALIISEGVTNPDSVELLLRGSARAPKHGDRSANLYGAGVVDARAALTNMVRGQFLVRAFFLIALYLLLKHYIVKMQVHVFDDSSLSKVVALLTATGLPVIGVLWPFEANFVTRLLSHPIAEWDLVFGGPHIHNWLVTSSLFAVIGTASLGYGREVLRKPMGAFNLGVASYLCGELVMNTTVAPLGTFLKQAWLGGTVLVALWVSRMTFDVTINRRAEPSITG